MKDFNQIQAFLSVVEAGSFSKAAVRLNLPKSTVSHRVQELERHLGVSLLQRTTRQLNLTPAGEIYFRKSSALMRDMDRLEEETMSDQNEPQGILKFTAPLESASSLLPPLLAGFVEAYPKIHLNVDLTDRRIDLIREGYDVALRAGQLEDSSLRAKPVGQAELCLYASPAYLKKAPALEKPEHLDQHRCLDFMPDNRDWVWKLTSGASRREVRPQGRFRCNSFLMVREMAILGQGIALLPRSLAGPLVEKKILARALPSWGLGRSPVSLVYAPQTFRSKRLEVFLNYMVPRLREQPW